MKTIFSRRIRVIDVWVLGAVLLVMALISCTPQPAPAVIGPLPTTTLVAASTTTAAPLPTPGQP
jgi:hypothetical protein